MEPREILVQLMSLPVPTEDEDDEPTTEEGREDT